MARILIRINSSSKFPRFKNRSGFSLLEVIVALAILVAVLLPFMSFVSFRLSKERQNDELIRAIEILKTKMEEVTMMEDVQNNEEVIDNRFLLKTEVVIADNPDEPQSLLHPEIRLSIYRLKDNRKLFELCALK